MTFRGCWGGSGGFWAETPGHALPCFLALPRLQVQGVHAVLQPWASSPSWCPQPGQSLLTFPLCLQSVGPGMLTW